MRFCPRFVNLAYTTGTTRLRYDRKLAPLLFMSRVLVAWWVGGRIEPLSRPWLLPQGHKNLHGVMCYCVRLFPRVSRARGSGRGGALPSPPLQRGKSLSLAGNGSEFRRSRAYETRLPVFEGLRRVVLASSPPTPGSPYEDISGTKCLEFSHDGEGFAIEDAT